MFCFQIWLFGKGGDIMLSQLFMQSATVVFERHFDIVSRLISISDSQSSVPRTLYLFLVNWIVKQMGNQPGAINRFLSNPFTWAETFVQPMQLCADDNWLVCDVGLHTFIYPCRYCTSILHIRNICMTFCVLLKVLDVDRSFLLCDEVYCWRLVRY